MSRPAIRIAAVSQASPADKWISRAAGGTVAALAGLAGAISYSHMRQLAAEHGQAGWHAHAFPLSVDGLELVASLVLLADRRRGRRSGGLPWAALITGTIGSLAANIATAHPDAISRIVAGWPALALLIAIKLLSGMLAHHHGSDDLATSAGEPVRPPIRSLDTSTKHSPVPRSPSPVPPDPAGRCGGPGSRGRRQPGTPDREPLSPARPSAMPDLTSAIGVLLPVARAVKDELDGDGRAVTRDALAARLRKRGYPVRNSTVTILLRELRDDSPSGSGLGITQSPVA